MHFQALSCTFSIQPVSIDSFTIRLPCNRMPSHGSLASLPGQGRAMAQWVGSGRRQTASKLFSNMCRQSCKAWLLIDNIWQYMAIYGNMLPQFLSVLSIFDIKPWHYLRNKNGFCMVLRYERGIARPSIRHEPVQCHPKQSATRRSPDPATVEKSWPSEVHFHISLESLWPSQEKTGSSLFRGYPHELPNRLYCPCKSMHTKSGSLLSRKTADQMISNA